MRETALQLMEEGFFRFGRHAPPIAGAVRITLLVKTRLSVQFLVGTGGDLANV